jgi:hypothetical protein
MMGRDIFSLAVIVTTVAVAAHGQINTTAPSNALKAEPVADAAGNLHVPDDYRTCRAQKFDPGRCHVAC